MSAYGFEDEEQVQAYNFLSNMKVSQRLFQYCANVCDIYAKPDSTNLEVHESKCLSKKSTKIKARPVRIQDF